MNLAPRAALLSGLLGLSGVFLSVLLGGFGLPTVVALVGFGLFGAGLFYGHGPLTAVGLTATALGAALAAGSSVGHGASLVVLGLGASAALITADASWWLRREPQVDPSVGRGLLRALVPVWVLGALLGAGAVALSRRDAVGIWLLPTGVVVTGGLIALVAWATRARHPRRDPLADIRR